MRIRCQSDPIQDLFPTGDSGARQRAGDTVTRQHNLVEAQKTTEVNIALRLGAVAAEITVTGEVPIVDKTSPASETRFRNEELETLTVARGYQNIFASAPKRDDSIYLITSRAANSGGGC